MNQLCFGIRTDRVDFRTERSGQRIKLGTWCLANVHSKEGQQECIEFYKKNLLKKSF